MNELKFEFEKLDLNNFYELYNQIQSLIKDADFHCIYENPYYISSWIRAFNPDHENLYLATLFCGSELVGFTLLLHNKNIKFINSYNSIGVMFGYSQPLIKDGFNKFFIEKLITIISEKHWFWQLNFRPSSKDWFPNNVLPKKVKFYKKIYKDSPYIELQKIKTELPLNKRLKTKLKAIEKEFDIQFVILESPIENKDEHKLMELVRTLMEFNRIRFPRGITKRDYEGYFNLQFELMKSPDSFANISYLKFNEQIISITFGLSQNNNYYYINPNVNANYLNFNPGHLLIHKLINYFYDRNFQIFDFLNSTEDYKFKWTNNVAYRYHYTITSHNIFYMNFYKVFIKYGTLWNFLIKVRNILKFQYLRIFIF